jgi:TPR repeat protein
MSSVLSNVIMEQSQKCAATHPWIDAWGWTWADSEKWDLANAGWGAVAPREPDLESLQRARDLSDAGDPSAAMPIWLSFAARGSAHSMLDLAISYEHGDGVSIDHEQAEIWYLRALHSGSRYAILKCAHFAASRNDLQASEAILQDGVDAGCASAQFWQAWYRIAGVEPHSGYQSILPLLKAAADAGHPGGRALLANLMMRGKFGFARIPSGLFRAIQLAISETDRHRSLEASPAPG